MLADLFSKLGEVDQTITTGLTAGIEATINQALRYDPASQQAISQLDDVLAVSITQPKLILYIRGQENGIHISNYCEDHITTHLTGSANALLNLLKQPSSLANTGVDLVGSTHLLQQWQTILHTLDIDWEDAISQTLGDIAGPLASNGLKKAAQWFTQQTRDHQRLASEYLPEEIKATPSHTELNDFYEDIDALKLNSDRLSARVDKLMHTIKNKGSL